MKKFRIVEDGEGKYIGQYRRHWFTDTWHNVYRLEAYGRSDTPFDNFYENDWMTGNTTNSIYSLCQFDALDDAMKNLYDVMKHFFDQWNENESRVDNLLALEKKRKKRQKIVEWDTIEHLAYSIKNR